jgi:hypothetical protein
VKTNRFFATALLAGWLTVVGVEAQTYVTPMMGGGQATADMIHIDLTYDAGASQLDAKVDNTYGTPELRPLDPGYAFDPQQPYGVLNGKAYNSQYGWNVGGLFALPPGTAIWIELVRCSPELETYSGWGRLASYTPLFGTAGSLPLWKWSGVMVHNTYAVLYPATDRLFAEYHIYLGDAETGSRTNYLDLGDTSVRLEWTTVPVADPRTFNFGAAASTNGAPLNWFNAGCFVTNSQAVVNMRCTNSGPCGLQYACGIPMLSVPATVANGGPVANHAALGSCLAFQIVSLTGPARATLTFWEAADSQPRFSVPVGECQGTNSFAVSENQGAPDADPYGFVPGRLFAVNQPGLYGLGFRVVDTSANGPAGGPLHAPSPLYYLYLQAGLTIRSLTQQGTSAIIEFGGDPGKSFCLERSAALGAAASWQTVAGPLPGTNCLQRLTDPAATGNQSFFRLRAE